MKYRIRVTPTANELIDELDAWWTENRPASASQVAGEVERTLSLLSETPGMGSIYRRRGTHVIRRSRLGVTPYFLYYVVNDKVREIVVIAAWSSERRAGPQL
jgi:plasmid stabilization system protein ParE